MLKKEVLYNVRGLASALKTIHKDKLNGSEIRCLNAHDLVHKINANFATFQKDLEEAFNVIEKNKITAIAIFNKNKLLTNIDVK